MTGDCHSNNSVNFKMTMDSSIDNCRAQALWYTAPGLAEIREAVLGQLQTDHCLVRTLFSGLSRGTESLVAMGRVCPADYDRMRAPHMEGQFPFPVKYGYANVGVVERGPDDLLGQTVFSLSPHQSYFQIATSSITPVNISVPPLRALLAANMETALNAIWNGAPGPADRITIVGGGVVGLLTGYLCAKLPGAEVTLVDINAARERQAHALGMSFAQPDDTPKECDLVVHASGVASGLNTAISLAGEEATILELSWFGSGDIPVALGGAFHSRQLKLISSQVGHMAASRRPRWDYARRLSAAIRLLDDEVLDVLLDEPIPLHSICQHLPRIFNSQSAVLCQPISY